MTHHVTGQRATSEQVLKSSTDREALERAATTLARSQGAGDLSILGQRLRDPEFLARLDDLSNLKTRRLRVVLAALAEHPTPSAVALLLTLAEAPSFVAEGERKTFVLKLLAAISR